MNDQMKNIVRIRSTRLINLIFNISFLSYKQQKFLEQIYHVSTG